MHVTCRSGFSPTSEDSLAKIAKLAKKSRRFGSENFLLLEFSSRLLPLAIFASWREYLLLPARIVGLKPDLQVSDWQ
jgi:hypothetical protein